MNWACRVHRTTHWPHWEGMFCALEHTLATLAHALATLGVLERALGTLGVLEHELGTLVCAISTAVHARGLRRVNWEPRGAEAGAQGLGTLRTTLGLSPVGAGGRTGLEGGYWCGKVWQWGMFLGLHR